VHLNDAWSKKLISEEEYSGLWKRYNIIGKRLSRWIHYLHRSDWENRG
jgi:hypothetical protein